MLNKTIRISASLFVFIMISVPNLSVGSDIKTIDTAQLHSMVVDNAYMLEAGREKKFTVIDARTRDEYDDLHILSAVNVPEKDFEKFAGRLPKDKSRPLAVYCNDAKLETCRKWASKAVNAGYTNVAIYSEGLEAWKKNSMPIAPLKTGVKQGDK